VNKTGAIFEPPDVRMPSGRQGSFPDTAIKHQQPLALTAVNTIAVNAGAQNCAAFADGTTAATCATAAAAHRPRDHTKNEHDTC